MNRILYVEDDPHSRSVMSMVERMHSGSIELTMLEDSYQFEERILRLHIKPDIILLDIHVAPLDGFEMLHIIQRNAVFNNIPIIALTASVMDEEIRQLKDAGFQGLLAKPLDLDQFPNLLRQILDGKRLWHVF